MDGKKRHKIGPFNWIQKGVENLWTTQTKNVKQNHTYPEKIFMLFMVRLNNIPNFH